MKRKTNFPLAHHLGITSINNFPTGNYIQYTVIIYNGKESEKEYLDLTESLCCYLKLIHCK